MKYIVALSNLYTICGYATLSYPIFRIMFLQFIELHSGSKFIVYQFPPVPRWCQVFVPHPFYQAN